jgi:aldehyde dehydrogenase (NAD+)
LVFPDADLDAACNGIIAGIFAASGQTCIAGSRLIVHESIHDELVDRLVDRTRTIRLGDPLDMATEMGPLANVNQLNTVLGFLERATERGAKVAIGGRTSPDHGALFFEPTVLTGVQPDMEVAQEEIFGPVLSVLTFAEDRDAVRMANATKYGLAAGLWTQDLARAHTIAHSLRAGTVWVNSYRVVAPNVPFGGVGASGWGRENGLAAVEDYTETKAVWLELAGETRDPFKLG